MLCPRCNSENELGEKFCRFCGAPLIDTELFLDPKEQKRREKNRKKQQRLKEKDEQARRNATAMVQNNGTVPKRTYSLIEKAYQRDYTRIILSLAKSIIILVILLAVIYFIFSFVSVKYAESTHNYSVSGNDIPSLNYVVGDRSIKKVKYSFDNHIFKTQYIFENISNPTNDILKYTAYLTSNNKYQIIKDFDPSLENGNAKLAVKSVSTFEDMIVLEINWTKNSYSIIVYKEKSTLENSTNN